MSNLGMEGRRPAAPREDVLLAVVSARQRQQVEERRGRPYLLAHVHVHIDAQLLQLLRTQLLGRLLLQEVRADLPGDLGGLAEGRAQQIGEPAGGVPSWLRRQMPLQVRPEVRHALVAALLVPRDRLEGDPGQLLGNGGIDLAGIGGPAVHDLTQRPDVVADIGRRAGQGLVEDDAQRIDVAARLARMSLHSLRRQVGIFSDDGTGLSADAVLVARDPEVDELHGAGEREHDVLRADIAMDDAHLMGVLQRLAGAQKRTEGQPGWHQAFLLAQAALHLPEAAAGDVLHGQEVRAVQLAELEGPHDVRVVQTHRQRRLVDEHAHEVLRPNQMREHGLDDELRVRTAGVRQAGQPNLRHPADRESGDDFIAPESSTWLQGAVTHSKRPRSGKFEGIFMVIRITKNSYK